MPTGTRFERQIVANDDLATILTCCGILRRNKLQHFLDLVQQSNPAKLILAIVVIIYFRIVEKSRLLPVGILKSFFLNPMQSQWQFPCQRIVRFATPHCGVILIVETVHKITLHNPFLQSLFSQSTILQS